MMLHLFGKTFGDKHTRIPRGDLKNERMGEVILVDWGNRKSFSHSSFGDCRLSNFKRLIWQWVDVLVELKELMKTSNVRLYFLKTIT